MHWRRTNEWVTFYLGVQRFEVNIPGYQEQNLHHESIRDKSKLTESCHHRWNKHLKKEILDCTHNTVDLPQAVLVSTSIYSWANDSFQSFQLKKCGKGTAWTWGREEPKWCRMCEKPQKLVTVPTRMTLVCSALQKQIEMHCKEMKKADKTG